MKFVTFYTTIYLINIISIVVIAQLDASISTEGLYEYGNKFNEPAINEVNDPGKTSNDENVEKVNQMISSFGRNSGAGNMRMSTSKQLNEGYTQNIHRPGNSDVEPSANDEYSHNSASADMIAPPLAALNAPPPSEGVAAKTFQYSNDANLLSQMRKNDGFARNFQEGAEDDESITKLLKSFETDDQKGNPYHLGTHGDFDVLRPGTERDLNGNGT